MNVPNTQLILAAVTPIVEAFEQLGISYHIGGSVASSVHGIIRGTLDADLVADLRIENVRPLVKRLEANYYIDEDAVNDAVKGRSSFNAIHLDTMLKVDIFVLKTHPFAIEEQSRVREQALIEDTRPFYVSSPEDVILNKLEWYRMGGEISDRQWNDILGVLKVQKVRLDMIYLQKWARVLNVIDLLDRAINEAGLSENKYI